jgi:hypothetical protein
LSKLYVTQYAQGDAHCAKEPPLDDTPVTFGAEVKSAAFNPLTTFVRLHTDAICSVAFGKNPTATTEHRRMVAGQTEYFAVESGFKVSVIANT